MILRLIVEWDEYGIFQHRFRPEDVVLDVGAHIGSFSFACHAQGSRGIWAYEPYPGNFASLKQNVDGLSGISVNQRAVFRSDQPARKLIHSGPCYSETGSGNVMFESRPYLLRTGALIETGAEATAPVDCVSLDDALKPFERIALLKLDCGGSEFPILLTTRSLSKIDWTLGEYHTIGPERMCVLAGEARVDDVAAYTPELLASHLRDAGFEVKIRPASERLGYFEARRR